MLSGCGGGGAAAGTAAAASGVPATTTAASAVPVAATLSLSATPTTVKSDDSTSTTITIAALNANNAAIPGVTVTLSADSGFLGLPFIVTGAAGTGTVTFTTGASRINRTATITATAGAASAQIPLQVVGSTLTVGSTANTLPNNGLTPVTLTITARDAGNNLVPNAAVALTQAGAGTVTLTPTSGVTNASGQLTVTAAGVTAGAVTVNATALGATGTTALTVSPAATTFSLDQTTNGAVITSNPTITAMKIGDSLIVRVNAPAPMANVIFATSTGIWDGTSSVVSVPVFLGKATATLTTTQAGVANVQVYDAVTPATSDTLTVAMTSGAAASSITLQPTPSVVPRSIGTTTGSSVVIALVRDAAGLPVGNAPVAFSIVNPTGSGETVSPVVVFTAATTAGGLNLGEARASFTSGSASSGAGGVQVRASVVGTAVSTQLVGVANATTSGFDATIVVGGTAGSVAFGQATSIATDATNANYVWDMSVLVADSNGNPAPLGTQVSLSAWPIAWSTGTNCAEDANTATTGTFYNEDANENLILDGIVPTGEDGARAYYDGVLPVGATQDPALLRPGVRGIANGLMTPINSAGGTLPGIVTTDANGVAAFKLTYTKNSAIWTRTRIRATTVVQGSATVGQIILQLGATAGDTTPCRLGNSPYTF